MVTMMVTKNFSEIKKQEIRISNFGGGEEIRFFGQKISQWSVHGRALVWAQG